MSLYSLKQSGHVWNTRIDKHMRSIGFTCLILDECIYIKNNDRHTIIFAIYIDDIGLFSDCKELIDWVKTTLWSEFEITDLGEMRSILGIEITQD